MRTLMLLAVAAGLFASASTVVAQPGHDGHGGMMMGDMPDDIKKMMQEPNKALAQASIQYMTVFTQSLHTQATERRDRIDSAYIKAAFAEMKRAYSMIDGYQAAHVKTMDAAMQGKVQMMMTKMSNNLVALRKLLDDLEKEVNGTQNLDAIAERTREILRHLDDMPKPRTGGMGMPGGKPMMQ